jgi:hypothetical protein
MRGDSSRRHWQSGGLWRRGQWTVEAWTVDERSLGLRRREVLEVDEVCDGVGGLWRAWRRGVVDG